MARKSPLGFALAACVLCALCLRPGLADEASDECVAQASAKAAELSQAAEAVANAVAATLTRTINCETGELDESDTTLSFALAIAISEVTKGTQDCPAEADAQAGVAEFVSNEVQRGLSEVDSDKADTKVFDASARALSESVRDTVNESVPDDESTPDKIARQIFDAAKEILTALSCGGSNVTPGTGLCTFTNGRFVGDCSEDPKDGGPSPARVQSAPRATGCRFLNGQMLCGR